MNVWGRACARVCFCVCVCISLFPCVRVCKYMHVLACVGRYVNNIIYAVHTQCMLFTDPSQNVKVVLQDQQFISSYFLMSSNFQPQREINHRFQVIAMNTVRRSGTYRECKSYYIHTINIHTYIHTHIYIHIYISYTQTHIHINTHTHNTHIHVWMCVCVCT